ncbi:MAG: hypothetical protein JNL58_31680 [Planctomyces sp.]|nr:hypothetical protein [Planctomyces sp.]
MKRLASRKSVSRTMLGAAVLAIVNTLMPENFGQGPGGGPSGGCPQECLWGYFIKIANSGSGSDPFEDPNYVAPSSQYFDVRLDDVPCVRRWNSSTSGNGDPQGVIVSHPKYEVIDPWCVDTCSNPVPSGGLPVELTFLAACIYPQMSEDSDGSVNCYHDSENEEELGDCIYP